MAFLSRGKKIDLYNLAIELKASVTSDDKIIDLHDKITTCTFFMDNEQFVKDMLDNIIKEREIKLERERIEREKKLEKEFEREKLRLEKLIIENNRRKQEYYEKRFQPQQEKFESELKERDEKFTEIPKENEKLSEAIGLQDTSIEEKAVKIVDERQLQSEQEKFDSEPKNKEQKLSRIQKHNEKLPAIRFAMNTAKCESTDHTAAYLTFARELRTLDHVSTDLRSIIHNDNFVPEFTPYLKRFAGYMSQIKENIEKSQDRRKTFADKSRKPSPVYKTNDLVWVKLHPLSKASQDRSAKLMPRKDGPYIVLSQRSPTTFVVASCDKPDEPLGVYHASALTPFLSNTNTETQSPVVPLRRRGRPRKQPLPPRGTAGENAMPDITPPRRDGFRKCRGRM